MALYLGSQKVGITTLRGGSSGGINYASGKVTSDDNGVVTFPQLDFTPTMIVVWNVSVRDLSENYEEENGEPFPEDWVRYLHQGIMLFAINQEGMWISQGIRGNSGDTNITNSSWDGGTGEFKPQGYSSSGVSINDGIYSYQLCRFTGEVEDYIMNTEFNYAIYG